ncbi:hypothetical protein CR956_00890 [Candidatus Saccharibacteria bacterium]|nr:MAG: hypothetical protein CR956_00890 [Candidatus Saccharibacteria bacterium]
MPLVLVAIVGIALIAGIVALANYLFSNNKASNVGNVTKVTPRDELLKLSNSRSVKMTVRGPIVANEEFRSYSIIISPNMREYKKYTGYLDDTKFERVYGNSMKAYQEVVYALDKAAMTKPGKAKPGSADDVDDVRGICATGKVYEYEILDYDRSVYRAWTSTCKGSPGTFGANVAQVSNLFIKQIPEEDRPRTERGARRLF